jgi:ABC-2 type transport system permease protein
MNKFKSLVILQMKDFLGRASSGMNIKNAKPGKLLPILFVIAIATPAINFSLLTFDTFARLGQPELVITAMYVNTVILMFILGLPFIVSIFFYSRDIRFLSALPVKEDVIVFAKLSTVYLYMLVISTIFIGPAIVTYLVKTGGSLFTVFLGLLTLILTPLLPLAISAILILITSRFFSQSRRRNLLAILSNLILLVVIIGLQLGLSRYIANPEYLARAMQSKEGLLGIIGLRFPPSIWMTRMILGSFRDTILFLGLNLLMLVIIQFLARLFFRRALLSFSQEGSGVSGRIYYTQHSKGYQLLKRHILIILKQPTFMLNTLFSLIVPLIMFAIMSFTGEFSLEMLTSPQVQPYMLLIFTGIITSPAIIANISSTAITREGQAFWETRVLPVSVQENIRYRVLTTIFLNLTGSAILLSVSLFLLPVTLKMVLLGSLFCLFLTLFLATIDIIVNIYRPMLDWTNPTAAVKNNLNVMISLGIRAVIALVVYGLYTLFPGVFGQLDVVVGGGSVVFLVLYLVVRRYLYTYYSRLFARISL